jgi:hypothetical protein
MAKQRCIESDRIVVYRFKNNVLHRLSRTVKVSTTWSSVVATLSEHCLATIPFAFASSLLEEYSYCRSIGYGMIKYWDTDMSSPIMSEVHRLAPLVTTLLAFNKGLSPGRDEHPPYNL